MLQQRNDLSESYPLMNNLVVMQQPQPDYPNMTNNEYTSSSLNLSMTVLDSSKQQNRPSIDNATVNLDAIFSKYCQNINKIMKREHIS